MRNGEAPPDSDRTEGAPHPRAVPALFGRARAEAALLDAYRNGRLHHAWLIGGPRGSGKATLAWRFARFLLAHPDPNSPAVRDARSLAVAPDHPAALRVAAGAPGDVAVLRRGFNEKTGRFFTDIRVDEVRRAAALFQQASRAGGYRICVVDSAEDLNASSANALLKLVEEPPALSLFLVLAHRPAQVLPTLRSRCRRLLLDPLGPGDAADALGALGPPWSGFERASLEEAAARAGGSVSGAMAYLGGERLALDRDARRLLDGLPDLDWAGLHRLADRIGADEDAFGLLVEAVLGWLHARAAIPAAEPRRLAPLTEVWDNVRRSAREALALNLDKRTFLFSTFAELAQATRAL